MLEQLRLAVFDCDGTLVDLNILLLPVCARPSG